MKLELNIPAEDLHHAYLIESDMNEGVEAVSSLLQGLGIPTRGNPDFHHYEYDSFLIEHAHTLRSEQSFHGSEGARKIFLVTFNTIMSEAQNSLLKTLEEPTKGTHFFFVTKTAEILLPTVRSRMQIIRRNKKETNDNVEDPVIHGFLRSDLAGRMEIISPITKAKVDDKPQAKEDARIFLESLERALYRRLKEGEKVEEVLAYVLEARRALSERAPSLKILLEHIALLCPRVSSN